MSGSLESDHLLGRKEIERALGSLFAGRLLPSDSDAARFYAEIVTAHRVLGRPVSQADGQIAAIARSRDMVVATRNFRGFQNTGVDVFDPWDSA